MRADSQHRAAKPPARLGERPRLTARRALRLHCALGAGGVPKQGKALAVPPRAGFLTVGQGAQCRGRAGSTDPGPSGVRCCSRLADGGGSPSAPCYSIGWSHRPPAKETGLDWEPQSAVGLRAPVSTVL